MTDNAVIVPEGFTLEAGRARVSSIDVHHNTPEFIAIEIDMHSKYINPMIMGGATYFASEDGVQEIVEPPEIHFFDGERALRMDESTDKMTVLHLPAHAAGWCVIATGGRYTIQIAAWKRPEGES